MIKEKDYLLKRRGPYGRKHCTIDDLLAGYNTMSREEKAEWDEKRLLRFSGKCIIVLSILPIGMELLILAGLPFGPVYGIGWTVYVLLIVWMIVYMNTKKRFRKK